MAIIADTKDWTWVLRRPCPECGFDTQDFPREQLTDMIRDAARTLSGVLSSRVDARERPNPQTWSPLEYSCHVRDMFTIFRTRLLLMLTQDNPQFVNWDQDATAVAERYEEQHPAEVTTALGPVAEALAAAVAGLTDDQWDRTGRRSDGTEFTVESLLRYMIHDVVHHVYDVAGHRHQPA